MQMQQKLLACVKKELRVLVKSNILKNSIEKKMYSWAINYSGSTLERTHFIVAGQWCQMLQRCSRKWALRFISGDKKATVDFQEDGFSYIIRISSNNNSFWGV